ncbi:hypothetical protein LU674_017530 [Pseudomonas alloputida]|jgi:hypothetical protein|uniref:Uncharacterized protein n=2 Tax=Pseudomonas TaxID=286 RepID=A0A7W2JH01_9PSED|nr:MULTISPECIES: hypothetical protein [Pseudomonas]MBA1216411.1 hypothetical protein [Pseudomonas fulva]MBA1319098.1 hypothetical protein [Pseudomonas monteilii]MBA6058783.1 hypothetical protein [Pseudomonas juntendi]MBA6105021.1 hypothetical protein [Pseudomonas monteilii]MBA6126016.1 hypothetical protein [Pseudomonas juntendi]
MRALPIELERRISLLEQEQNQGSDFDSVAWFWLVALGVVFPAAVAAWGWA